MGSIIAFLTLVAGFIFAMGLVTNAKGTVQVVNATANALTNLFTLELGQVPKKQLG